MLILSVGVVVVVERSGIKGGVSFIGKRVMRHSVFFFLEVE